ncbi:hypothetical protein PVK06_048590 [Gossypium arboreum]|uniref:Uncharacterized protein n=1 Tax=Gossypium arboreum TaxID=29729 RepID=A0ABR0MGV3_GOSAR|nr:hypothetical protein PVK06_048590 [Gossypium arboreum]
MDHLLQSNTKFFEGSNLMDQASWFDRILVQMKDFVGNRRNDREGTKLHMKTYNRCRRNEHVKEMCTFKADEHNTTDESLLIGLSPKNQNLAINNMLENRKTYGSWMLVEKKSR